MGQIIVKVERDRDDDLYVVWSDNVDAPMCWGTKAEVFDYLLDRSDFKPEVAGPETLQRFERAEEFGSSSYIRDGWWGDEGFIYHQKGLVPRARLREFLDSYDEATGLFDLTILEAFER